MIKRISDLSTKNKVVGAAVLLVLLLTFVVAYEKQRVVGMLTPGDTVTASFTRQYKLDPYLSVVKLASVRVGAVTDIERADDGGAKVTMKLDKGTIEKLGGEPSATIRPTLVVGGVYYVELTPGGRGGVFNGDIPVERTGVPVELDHVLSAINTAAQKGLQGFTRHLDDTLQAGGRDAIRQFLHAAPPALQPTGDVLTAVRGTDPDQDLTRLVSGFEGFAAVFNRKQGQFADILDSFDTTTDAFSAQRGAVTETLGTLPETLRITRAGLSDLQGSLDRLTETAPRFRDSAKELDPLMRKLGPLVSDARPLADDLNHVLDDALPAVRSLVPVADKGDDMFRDIHGPVLDRVNGPIKYDVLHPWHGVGVYANGGNDHTMYQELAYLVSVLDGAFKYKDQNGGLGRLQGVGGANTLTGGSQFPRSSEEFLMESMLGQKPYGPQDSKESDRGLSRIGTQKPINQGMKPLPAPGPAPIDGGNPLMLPMRGGEK
jgi:phospholipid/cholesterol/gamma-HCH transport system substrate-binding protein